MKVTVAVAIEDQEHHPPCEEGGQIPEVNHASEEHRTREMPATGSTAQPGGLPVPRTTVVVKLSGTDGNAFSLIARVRQALRRGGHADLVDEFTRDAMSGDYSHLLHVVCLFVVAE